MEGDEKHTWMSLVGLAAAGLMIFGAVYGVKRWTARPETYSPDPGRGKIVLAVDEAVQLGSEKLIYKGLADQGRFVMAVVLLEMDPEYFYIHRIGIREAKAGFSLVGHRFELISASRSRIRLWHIKNPAVLAMALPRSNNPGLDPFRLGPKEIFGP